MRCTRQLCSRLRGCGVCYRDDGGLIANSRSTQLVVAVFGACTKIDRLRPYSPYIEPDNHTPPTGAACFFDVIRTYCCAPNILVRGLSWVVPSRMAAELLGSPSSYIRLRALTMPTILDVYRWPWANRSRSDLFAGTFAKVIHHKTTF